LINNCIIYLLNAGIDKIYRDLILGHSLKGMDIHYLAPSEESLKNAMNKFTIWLDGQIAETQKTLTEPLTETKKEVTVLTITP
jgi:hypothetical protein